MIKVKSLLQAVLGISTEIIYTLVIIAAAFLICWAIYFKL